MCSWYPLLVGGAMPFADFLGDQKFDPETSASWVSRSRWRGLPSIAIG
jgi:hypothetical protein